MKLLVAGGGTSGLISALILKKRLDIEVDIVHSPNIGIIGVGEGSTEHFNEFMKLMGIDFHTIIKECGATFKSGIMFEGWSDTPYLHSVGENFVTKAGEYPYICATQISKGKTALTSKLPWENKIARGFLFDKGSPPYYQYHFDTFKLNEFLVKLAKSLGIGIYEDDINEVILANDGSVEYLIGNKKNYKYDFYIDCTGFRRVIISKLGAKWTTFNKYLKMKAAITFQTPDEDEYNVWTLAKAMDYGWMFKIPVWGRHGNGYIFDSDYVSADKAKEEIDKIFGYDVDIIRQFNFDPGSLDSFWIKNCVAVGLSGLFVEPLEATSIGASIQQTFLLMHKLINYTESSIKHYNLSMKSIVENLRDFLILHYITNKDNSPFWIDINKMDIPDSLLNLLEHWKHHMPIQEDLMFSSRYSLFRADNFAFIMAGLGLFNKESIHKELNSLDYKIKLNATEFINYQENLDKTVETLGHKEFITKIRNR